MDEEVKEVEEEQDGEGKGSGEEKPANLEEMAGLDLDVNLHTLGEEPKEEPPVKEEDKEEPKGEEKKVAAPSKDKDLEDRISRLERDKSDLKKALHEARQERKKAKVEEPQAVLTDAELQKIVEEHKDDPKVMFNAVAYKVQQMMKTGKAEAVNEVETKQRRDQLTTLLRERVKDWDDEASEPRVMIGRAKTDFNLEDHPFGDFLGAAAAVYIDLPNIAKGWIEEGRKEALNGKAEESRKEGIKKSQLAPGGSKTGISGKREVGLTPSQMETAKRLGFTTPEKLKLYRSQILKVTNA